MGYDGPDVLWIGLRRVGDEEEETREDAAGDGLVGCVVGTGEEERAEAIGADFGEAEVLEAVEHGF